MVFTDKYSSAENFPSHDVSPEEKKGSEWTKQWVKAVYSQYSRNQSGIGTLDHKKYSMLRAYANGEQPTDKYEARLSPPRRSQKGKSYLQSDMEAGKINPNSTQPDRKGFSAINYEDKIDVATKYLQVVIDRYHDQQHDVTVDSISPAAINEKEEAKFNLWMEKEFGEIIKQAHIAASIPPPENPEFAPNTKEDLEMWAEVGGFKQKNEISMELAIMATFLDSNQDEVQLKQLTDAYVLNSVAGKDYTDKKDGKVKVAYVNPERFIISHAENGQFDRINYAGELRKVSVLEVIPYLKNESDEEVKNILESYGGLLGNPACEFDSYNSQEAVSIDVLNAHSDMQIWIFEGEFLTIDGHTKSETTTKRGKKILKDEEYGFSSEKENVVPIQSDMEVYYRAKWIVGSDVVFDYGLQYDINRSNDLKSAKSSYHYYHIRGKSKQEVIIPFIDNIQMAWYRLQNAIAKARPAGLAIEVTALENISINDKQLHPLDVMQIAREDGTLLYKATTHRGHYPTASVSNPFQELKGGIGEQLNEFVTIIELNLNLIAETTGVPRIAAGGEPTEDQGLGLAKIAESSSNKATNYIAKAYLEVKKSMCMNVCRRIQLWVKSRPEAYEIYAKSIGKIATQHLKISAETGGLEFAVQIVPRPSFAAKQRIMEAARDSMSIGKQGGIGISMSDYLLIEKIIDRGRLSYAQAMLAQKESEAAAKAEQIAANNSKRNDEGQQASNKQTHDNAVELETLKSKLKREEIREQLVVTQELKGIEASETQTKN
jgi:hypothetical protein